MFIPIKLNLWIDMLLDMAACLETLTKNHFTAKLLFDEWLGLVFIQNNVRSHHAEN